MVQDKFIESSLTARISLGTVQFGIPYGVSNLGGITPLNEARRIINGAAKYGVDTLDTAISYGVSESILGQIGVNKFRIITKIPSIPDDLINVEAWLWKQVDGALSRLGVNSVHAILLHRPDQLFGSRGKQIKLSLERFVATGITNKVGVSIYKPEELLEIMSSIKVDIVQAPLNILDRRFVESGWVKKLHQQGIEIHVRSIFLQGLLLMEPKNRPEYFNHWNRVWHIWDTWLNQHEISPIEACLSYVQSIQDINKFVIGVNDVKQLLEIFSGLSHKMPPLPVWPSEIGDKLIDPREWKI